MSLPDLDLGTGFYAFISYRHIDPDQRWAKWLHSAIETYRVPKRLVKERNLPVRIRPLFRDDEELAASPNLSESIQHALVASRFLIVVCSPNAPGSRWIDQEIVRFRELGRDLNILALLISGEPNESFPPALREIGQDKSAERKAEQEPETIEPLAADVRPRPGMSSRQRKRTAKLRIIARLLGCEFDELYQRDQARRIRIGIQIGLASFFLALTLAGMGYYGFYQRHQALRGSIDTKLVQDAGQEMNPFDVERWRRLDNLLREAKAADYPEGVSVIRKRLTCLFPPSARQEKTQFEELPEKLLVNETGTRICAIYKDRLEILDAATYRRLFSFVLPRPLNEGERYYAIVDGVHDRVIYCIDSTIRNAPFLFVPPRLFFAKTFGESAPYQLNIPPWFEASMPFPNKTKGTLFRLRVLPKLISANGVFQDLSGKTEQLRLQLGLTKLSGVVPIDYDPAAGLGMYRVYTLDREPQDESENEPGVERVVLYDGHGSISTLGEEKRTTVSVKPLNSSRLDFGPWDQEFAALDAQHGMAILGNQLFRFSGGRPTETTTLNLLMDEVEGLQIASDGESIFIEFQDGSVGLYEIQGDRLHRVFPFKKIVLQYLQAARRQVWIVDSEKKLEAWDLSVFQSNGWGAAACPPL